MRPFPAPRFLAAVALGFCLLVPTFPLAAAEPAPASAADLAARLSAKQQDGNAYVRMRLEISGPKKDAIQIQGKLRSTRGSSERVYQVLWPKERKGESVLLRRSGNRAASGTVFTPADGATRPLDAAQMREPFFGSDLAYEDVIENFFDWEQQTLAGTETVDNVPCQILESKPGKGERSSYATVRTWVDPRRLVPLRVEKLNAAGKVVRRIETTRVATDDQGRVIPANLSVRGPGGDSVTALDGGKITHAINFSDAEFTPEGLKQTVIPRGSPE